MQSGTSNPLYALQDVPGKGKGLVATELIPKGTRILSEEPIITVHQKIVGNAQLGIASTSIREQVDALSEPHRRAFLSMHNIHEFESATEQHLGIFRTNALPADTDGGGIFLNACRINHACDNNAQKHWNEKIKRNTVHTLRDIDEGEEITIYYLSIDMPHEARQQALQAKFGFTCTCRLCSLPAKESQKSDKRLSEIYRLDGLVGQGGLMKIMSSPLQMLRYVDQRVRLYNEQRTEDAGLPRAFLDAAQIAITHGDLARGRIFTERAVSGWLTAHGDDSKEVIENKALAQDPRKLQLYGLSMKWETAVEDFPREFGPDDFEDWLWKREKPQRPGQLADLRNRSTFPAFNELPDENEVDEHFYRSIDMGTYEPRRHWCFLGEIKDHFTLTRLQMEIEGIDGIVIPLFFYTDGRGRELVPAQVQKGNTIAILHAQRHAFLFSPPGIRHEIQETIKIFPLPLHELLRLSDRIQQFSMETGGIRMCHGCGKKSTTLKKCGKCCLFWYCNRACQEVGWNEKGHKADCKALKDPDLRSLFLIKWDEYNGDIRFPLRLG
ncbi:SET domain-containing protein [Lachnellula suecica]|uniref:SET domain-containing protein n=1 Tax=Lachnellula suecica TaxID=602035 RepID=A0A8T9C1F4_9HELO|nr:SET domain-containing protein [Lachnellula suecica]